MGTWAQREREGTQRANGRTVIAESSLTCTSEAAERANQGQQEQQLNSHCRENVSPSVKTFRDSLRAKSTTPEASHTLLSTRQAHTDQPLRRGRVKDRFKKKKKGGRIKIKSSGEVR